MVEAPSFWASLARASLYLSWEVVPPVFYMYVPIMIEGRLMAPPGRTSTEPAVVDEIMTLEQWTRQRQLLSELRTTVLTLCHELRSNHGKDRWNVVMHQLDIILNPLVELGAMGQTNGAAGARVEQRVEASSSLVPERPEVAPPMSVPIARASPSRRHPLVCKLMWCKRPITGYFRRMLGHVGGSDKGPNIPHAAYLLWAWAGVFCGIFGMSLLEAYRTFGSDNSMIVASFGAQAVLVYGVPQAPFAQPWNAIGGNTLAAFVGVFCRKFFGGASSDRVVRSLASALAVSLATLAMLVTGSVHPPAGATALIAVIGSDDIKDAGWEYIVFPILIGSMMNVAFAVLLNNLSQDPTRSYPVYWKFWTNFGRPFPTVRARARDNRSSRPQEPQQELWAGSDGTTEELVPWFARWPIYQAPGTTGAVEVEPTSPQEEEEDEDDDDDDDEEEEEEEVP